MARTASRATRAVQRRRSAAPSSTRTWRAPSTSFVNPSRRDELAHAYLRNRATPKGDLPAGFVWGVQPEWRHTCGTWCRDLGRQATGPEDPVDHGRLVDQRDQTQAAATAGTRQDVKCRTSVPSAMPSTRRGRSLNFFFFFFFFSCRRELSAHWPFVLARLLGGFPGAPDASIGDKSPLVRTRRF